jgi:hypothetical protein
MKTTIDPKTEELRIGRLLAAGLEEMAAGTPCLSDEQLNNLVAAIMSGAERDAALSHAAGCAECRHALVIAHRLAQPDEPEVSKVVNLADHKRSAWSQVKSYASNYTVPLALAASLLLAIGLYRFSRTSGDTPLPGLPGTKPPVGEVAKVEAPPQTPQVAQSGEAVRKPNRRNTLLALAGTLGKANRGRELDIPFVSANQAGFAGSGGDEVNRFHTGFALFSLAAACEGGDAATLHRAAASLSERITKLNLPESGIGTLLPKAEKMITDTPTPETCRTLFAANWNVLDKQFNEDPHLNLGYWIAALRFSVQQKNGDTLHDPIFLETLRSGTKLSSPAGVVKKLVAIIALSEKTLDDKDWQVLEDLADDVQKRY